MNPDTVVQRQYYTERWKQSKRANWLELVRVAKLFECFASIEPPPPESLKICDLGCGHGWATSLFNHFGETTGVDLSDTQAAQSRYPDCHFISANILQWDAPPETYDVVCSMEVVEHIPRELQSQYFLKAWEILKPGGYLLLTTPNARTMHAIRGGGRTYSNQPVEDWLSQKDLRDALGSARFRVERLESFVLGVGDLGLHRFMKSVKVGKTLDAIGLGRIWRRLAGKFGFGLHLVTVARKQ